jgi:hypothetical protein
MRSNCTGQREKRVDHKRDEVYIGVLYALSHGVEKGCEDPRGRLHHGMTGSSLRHGLAGPLRSGLRDCFVDVIIINYESWIENAFTRWCNGNT